MLDENDMPEQDELVLATIKKIMPYGAFCSLDEYQNKEAFVHISEVAPRWIKNIHEFLHDGEHVVAKVYNLVLEKNQVDLSLKRVTPSEKKLKLEMVKRTRRADKLFEVSISEAKLSPVEAIVAKKKLIAKFGDLFEALEEISLNGEDALKDLKIDRGLAKTLVSICQKSIKQAKAEIKGMLKLQSFEPNGVEVIKKAIGALVVPATCKMTITYLGAPRYKLDIVAPDFKTGEKALEGIIESLDSIASKNTIVSFERIKEEN